VTEWSVYAGVFALYAAAVVVAGPLWYFSVRG
jgi:heme/copper-type cytochrome/quinol oxidase subunit 4